MRLTDADQLLTLETVDVDVSVHMARSERIEGKLRLSVPDGFLLRGRPEFDDIVSHFCLVY